MENFEKPVLKFYSLKSKSLEFFNAPFIASSDVEALLTVRNAIASGQIPPHVVSDCDLYFVGFFHTSNGNFSFVPLDDEMKEWQAPIFLCALSDIKIGGLESE